MQAVNDQIAAHVPIKEQSERLPRKNFREFNGRPLYYWIFNTLSQVELIDEIYLNTDSEEVAADICEDFEVSIIDRPPSLRGQHTSMNDILLHDISIIDADLLVHTHCTAPLLRVSTVSDAISRFIENDEFDSLFTGGELRKWLYDADLNPINHNPQKVERSQDLEPIIHEDGILYIIPIPTFKQLEARVGENPMLYELSPIERIEIDYDYEFKMAEYFHKEMALQGVIESHYRTR